MSSASSYPRPKDNIKNSIDVTSKSKSRKRKSQISDNSFSKNELTDTTNDELTDKTNDKLTDTTKNKLTDTTNDEDLPKEIENDCLEFFEKIKNLEKCLLKLFQINLSDLETSEVDPLQQASLRMLQLYGLNSLFWVYLILCGVDPEPHDILHELNRIESYIKQLKTHQNKDVKKLKLDKEVAERYIKASLPKDLYN